MEKKLICGDTYEFSHQTIALPIILKGIPDEVILNKDTFIQKTSFHVSLVCIGEIIKKHNITIPDFENLLINDFCDFTKNNKVEFLRYTNEFKFVTRDNLKSIIVMCEVSNLDKFFDLTNKKYSLQVEYPPTHVTLYTPESKPGIFLSDSSDIERLTINITDPIGGML